jgi:hypothetical protein
VPGGALHRERLVSEADDDDHGGLGEDVQVEPGGGAVAEAGRPDAVERRAGGRAGDLPPPFGTAVRRAVRGP